MVLPGFKGLGFRAFLRRLGHAINEDALLDTGGLLAYFFVFALFPFLFFLVTLTAYLPLRGSVETLFARAADIMPTQALSLVQDQVNALLSVPRPRLLTASLLIALWSASRGLDAFRKSLNLAYDVSESRSFVRVNLLAIAMTVASSLLMLVSFATVLLGGKVGEWLFGLLGLGTQFRVVWSWLRWPTTAFIITGVAAINFYFLPDVKQSFRYITPGSVTSSVLWLLTTWGFTQYVDHFGHFNATYGSIGGVIVLMTWLYISSCSLLLGGEINAVIEHASAEGKAPGERVPGQGIAPESRGVRPGPDADRGGPARKRFGFWRKPRYDEPEAVPEKRTLH